MKQTASLGANKFLLAVPQSRIFDSVTAVGSQSADGRGCRAEPDLGLGSGIERTKNASFFSR